MKNSVLIVAILVLMSCGVAKKFPASKNKEGHLVGVATKKDFQQEPYASEWFNDYYSYYEVDEDVVEKLKPLVKDVTIKAFMGTWCDDSRREIPNFYKTMDATGFNYSNLELITVNEKKKAKRLEKGYKITHVPTFIFYKNGKEIGRFVEYAVGDGSTLEGDFLKILSGEQYKHPYSK